MKIALNLSTAVTSRERFALAWGLPATLLALLGMGYLLVSASQSIRAYTRYHRDLADCLSRENQLKERENALRKDLDQPRYRELFREARFVNALIDRKQFSLTELMQQVTHLLPPDVRLIGFALTPGQDNSAVRFSVEGKSEETVEAFLSNLENSPDFSDVTVTNQGFEASEAMAGGPAPGRMMGGDRDLVVISCTATYLGGGPRGTGGK